MKKREKAPYDAKIIVLGAGGVGKTTLIDCFKSGPRGLDGPKFRPNLGKEKISSSFIPIGVEFDQHIFTTDTGKIKAQIWDTVGHERIRSINDLYYKGAKGALLIADISYVHESTEQLEKELNYWRDHFLEKADEGARMIIVGNKMDRGEETSTAETLLNFATQHNLPFWKTSAVNGTNVVEVVNLLVNLVNEYYFQNPERRKAYLNQKKANKNRKTLACTQEIVGQPKKKKDKCCL